jgi:hypothetical protein
MSAFPPITPNQRPATTVEKGHERILASQQNQGYSGKVSPRVSTANGTINTKAERDRGEGGSRSERARGRHGKDIASKDGDFAGAS